MSNHIISTCPQCGADLPLGTLSCGYCGHRIDLSLYNKDSGQVDGFHEAYWAIYPHVEIIVNGFFKELEAFLDVAEERISLHIVYDDTKSQATSREMYSATKPLLESKPYRLEDYCILELNLISLQEVNRFNELGFDTTLFDRYEKARSWYYASINITKEKCTNSNIKQLLTTLIAIRIANELSLKETHFKKSAMRHEIKISSPRRQKEERVAKAHENLQSQALARLGKIVIWAIVIFTLVMWFRSL